MIYNLRVCKRGVTRPLLLKERGHITLAYARLIILRRKVKGDEVVKVDVNKMPNMKKVYNPTKTNLIIASSIDARSQTPTNYSYVMF